MGFCSSSVSLKSQRLHKNFKFVSISTDGIETINDGLAGSGMRANRTRGMEIRVSVYIILYVETGLGLVSLHT